MTYSLYNNTTESNQVRFLQNPVVNATTDAMTPEENKINWVLLDRAVVGGLSNKEIIKILQSARPELFL